MAEQPWWADDDALERALFDLGARLDYPPAPRLAERVRARLLAAPAPAARQRGAVVFPRTLARRLVAALAAIVLLIGAVLAASPGARSAVAQWFSLHGVRIFYVPSLPTTRPMGRHLGLGRPVTLAMARRRVPYRILLPAALGAPDEVYLGTSPDGDRVTLLYRARRGLPRASTTGVGALLIESPTTTSPIVKMVPPGTRVSFEMVNGQNAFWFSGRPHLFFSYFTSGNYSYVTRTEQARLAGNVLLWGQSGLGTRLGGQSELLLRLEAQIPLREALRIAASLR